MHSFRGRNLRIGARESTKKTGKAGKKWIMFKAGRILT